LIVCLGQIVADIIAKPVLEMPEKGKLKLLKNISLRSGGGAVNTAISLSKLGIKASVIGKVGNDGFAKFVLEDLKKNNVETKGISVDRDAGTSANLVLVSSDGERSFLQYIGANAEFKENDINWEIIKKAKILHYTGALLLFKFDGKPAARVLKKVKELGITTSLDIVWDPKGEWMKKLRYCLPYVDIFVPSFIEGKMLTGKNKKEEIAEELLKRGVKTVAITLGKDGCYIRTKTEKISLPAYKTKVVDTTGAGDAFAAGFLTGYLRGYDLLNTGKLANAVACMCVSKIGGTEGIRSLKETLEFIKEKEN
jgi:sugar/nucleoside kinase (ribokinase family)